MNDRKESKLEFEISISTDGSKVIKYGNKVRRVKKDKEGIHVILKGDVK